MSFNADFPVLTPEGVRRADELQAGDIVATPLGPTSVVFAAFVPNSGIYPTILNGVTLRGHHAVLCKDRQWRFLRNVSYQSLMQKTGLGSATAELPEDRQELPAQTDILCFTGDTLVEYPMPEVFGRADRWIVGTANGLLVGAGVVLKADYTLKAGAIVEDKMLLPTDTPGYITSVQNNLQHIEISAEQLEAFRNEYF